MSEDLKNKDIIKSIVIGVSNGILNQKEEINTKLEESFKSRLEKVGFDENKYINSLKFNVLLYRVTIRNSEILIGKWIEKNNIPSQTELSEELQKINLKCRQYVDKASKEGIKTLNERDLKFFLNYSNLNKDEAKIKIENEYKNLFIYSEILNKTLHSIVLKKIHINSMPKNPTDGVKELKSSILMAINKISIISKVEVESHKVESHKVESVVEIYKETEVPSESKEHNEEYKTDCKTEIFKEEIENYKEDLKEIESNILNKIETLSYEQISSKMDKEYRVSCSLEEIKYSKGYGFGEDAIKEYAAAIILLESVDISTKHLIEGAIRLVINGEFGAINFSDYIDFIANNRVNIGSSIWSSVINSIEEKYTNITNHDLAKKETKPSPYIDIEEYIYRIENADKNEKFRTEEEDEIIEEIEVYEKPKNKKLLTGIVAVGAVACIVIGGLYINKAINDKKTQDEIAKNNVGNKTAANEENNEDIETLNTSDSEYIIADSNARILTEEELSGYTKTQLSFIRNEIFARHGYVFKEEPYKTYFSHKTWYTTDSSIKGNSEELNFIEKENLELIQKLEKSSQDSSKDNESVEIVSYEDEDFGYHVRQYYSVYTEACKSKSEAESEVKRLEKKGIYSMIIEEDGYYKVRVASDYDFEGAKEISNLLKEKSVKTYILAYDTDVENKIDEFNEAKFTESYETLERMYLELREELTKKLAYERYVKQLDAIYEGIVEGA